MFWTRWSGLTSMPMETKKSDGKRFPEREQIGANLMAERRFADDRAGDEGAEGQRYAKKRG